MSVYRPLLGGYNSKSPPTLLPPDQSPDVLNVVLNNRAVEKRGGFVPHRSRKPKVNSIRNSGFHTRARESLVGGSVDTDYLIVPGAMYAGHRRIYETLVDGITLEFVFQVGDLTTEHGGNAEPNMVQFGRAPYTLKVRPVLSKGPIKRTADPTLPGPVTGQGLTWNTTPADQYGGSFSGLPFCVYLFNNGGTWEWRLSFHVLDSGGVWRLRTVTSTIPVELDGVYHVIGQIDTVAGVATLRIGRLRGKETTTYVVDTTSLSVGDQYTQGSSTPIQVFDCPQQFIEATATGSSTQRPGLGLGGNAAGGYWFAAKRAEGRIEDIVLYEGPKITASPTALDRSFKLGDLGSGVINHWSMTEPGEGYVREMTGRGNHLYLCPAGPIFDGISGTMRGPGSWWFNGLTSHVQVDMENDLNFGRSNPNWRWLKDSVPGWMADAVRNNIGHGLQVEFWVDSIEPNFEQVIFEIHSVLRLAIGTDGKLKGYCRDGGGAPLTIQQQGALYQAPLTTSLQVHPGERYSVTLFRQTGGTQLDLYVNGVLETSVTGLTAAEPASNNGRPPSGITVGMGSRFLTVRDDGTGNNLPRINRLNTDSRSGFIGRIEQIRILGSDPTVQTHYKDSSEEDGQFLQTAVWKNPAAPGLRDQITPTDAYDPVANVGEGVALEISGHLKSGQEVRYLVDDVTLEDRYFLSQDTLANLDAPVPQDETFAHDDLAGLRVYTWHVLSQIVFNFDDRQASYGGAYNKRVEYDYPPTAGTQDPATVNHRKAVHTEFSAVRDDYGVATSVIRRCIESDILSDQWLPTNDLDYRRLSHRNKPYFVRSPGELAVRWAEGLMPALPGKNPITLVADWEDQSSSETFLVVAAARQVYWSRPTWRRSSPYVDEPTTRSLWLGGQQGDHLRVTVLAGDTQTLMVGSGTSKTIVVFECWLYPMRLDGVRLICARVKPSVSSQTNFSVYTVNGQLRVTGTMDGNTRVWSWHQGPVGSGANVRPSAALRVGVWNHLHVTIGGSPAPETIVRVNGDAVDGGQTLDPMSIGTADLPADEFYIGGLPIQRNVLTFQPTSGAFTVVFQAFHGMISDVRQHNAVDPAFPITSSGVPPKTRLTDGSNIYMLFPLSEGEGWHVDNNASNLPGRDGQVELEELVLLREGLEESRGSRYDHVVFRDRLFITNGRALPQQIEFTRHSDPDGPFRIANVGVAAPVATSTIVELTTGAPGTGVTDGNYLIWQTFVDRRGRESDPSEVGNFPISGGPFVTASLRLVNIPRSPDPQVVARNFYISANGGGTPIFFKQVPDNETTEVDFEISRHPNIGQSPEFSVRLPAPRARHIAVGSQSLILADLPDTPAGQNAFAVSQAAEPTFFTLEGLEIAIDSEDGRPITAIQGHLGQLFFSKRDSIWQFGYTGLLSGSNFQASLRPVFTSPGFGGGRAVQDNRIFGAGDRGVYAFDGGGVEYIGDALEGDWRSLVDKQDEGLVFMFGAWYRRNSQYWLSVRKRGEESNSRIYLLHSAAGPQLAWSLMEVPAHTYLSEVLDPDTQEVQILIGTTSGQILRYQDDVSGDYHADGFLSSATLQLEGSHGVGGETLSGTSTSLTTTGAGQFDDVGHVLRGAEIELRYWNGSTVVTATRPLVEVSRTTLRWIEPLAGFVDWTTQAGGIIPGYVIGGFDGYWTSGWMAQMDDQGYGVDHKVEFIDADFLPNDVEIELSYVGARTSDQVTSVYPVTSDLVRSLAMVSGYLNQPVKVQAAAYNRWTRVRFRTRGIRKPFGLVGWGMRWVPLAARGTPGRLS